MFPSLVPVVAGGRAPYIPPMLIETEATPNPASLKFLPGRAVMGSGGTREFATPEAADASPEGQAMNKLLKDCTPYYQRSLLAAM